MPATAPAVDPILRPARAAEALGITRSTLTRWRQRDDSPEGADARTRCRRISPV